MGAKVDGSGNSSGLVAEINVVPFVDIVLVVLIIFMVTAPTIMTPTLEITLPKAETAKQKKTENVVLTMGLDGQIALNGKVVSKKMMRKQVAFMVRKNKETRAVIAADKDVAYGRVIKLVDTIKKLGIQKFAVTVDQE